MMQYLKQHTRHRWHILIRMHGIILEEFYSNLSERDGYIDTWSIEEYIRRKYGVTKIITWIRGVSRTIIFDLFL